MRRRLAPTTWTTVFLSASAITPIAWAQEIPREQAPEAPESPEAPTEEAPVQQPPDSPDAPTAEADDGQPAADEEATEEAEPSEPDVEGDEAETATEASEEGAAGEIAVQDPEDTEGEEDTPAGEPPDQRERSASDLPPEGIPIPVYQPPAEQSAEEQGEQDANEASRAEGDTIRYSGYLPGYRRHFDFGISPDAPDVGSLPGPTTAGYGAPMPPSEWTFDFTGFLTVSSQMSFDHRPIPAPGQSTTVTHVEPRTIDTYGHFTSTGAVPGNWVTLKFRYGSSKVAANLSIDTYNPTAPTTFYQIGSQYFISNAFLSYDPAPFGDLRLEFQMGRFSLTHGSLGQYGSGMYVNPITGTMVGVGLRSLAHYDLNPKWELTFEHDLLTSRDGTIPFDVVRSQSNGWRRPLWVGSLMNGVHAGFNLRTQPRVEFRVRQVIEFAHDDRIEREFDDLGTRQVDESNLSDGSLTIYGTDLKVIDDTFGIMGVGASYSIAHHVFPLRGLASYGGYGEDLTDRFLGIPSGGNGRLFVAAINYSASVGKIASYPRNFDGQGPDVLVNTGFHYTRTESEFEGFDGRQRYKGGLDVEYAFFKYGSIAARVDRVIPDSREGAQSFTVLAPRLAFRTGWSSRLNFQIRYAKWFYGTRTRNEGAGERDPESLDDDLFAVNMNMWW